MSNNNINFDNTDYEKIDPRTDYGKGIYYIGKDGKPYTNIKDLNQANEAFWDGMRDYTVDDFNELLKNIQAEDEDFELDDGTKSFVEQLRTTRDSRTKDEMKKVVATRYEEIVKKYKNKGKGPRR